MTMDRAYLDSKRIERLEDAEDRRLEEEAEAMAIDYEFDLRCFIEGEGEV